MVEGWGRYKWYKYVLSTSEQFIIPTLYSTYLPKVKWTILITLLNLRELYGMIEHSIC